MAEPDGRVIRLNARSGRPPRGATHVNLRTASWKHIPLSVRVNEGGDPRFRWSPHLTGCKRQSLFLTLRTFFRAFTARPEPLGAFAATNKI